MPDLHPEPPWSYFDVLKCGREQSGCHVHHNRHVKDIRKLVMEVDGEVGRSRRLFWCPLQGQCLRVQGQPARHAIGRYSEIGRIHGIAIQLDGALQAIVSNGRTSCRVKRHSRRCRA